MQNLRVMWWSSSPGQRPRDPYKLNDHFNTLKFLFCITSCRKCSRAWDSHIGNIRSYLRLAWAILIYTSAVYHYFLLVFAAEINSLSWSWSYSTKQGIPWPAPSPVWTASSPAVLLHYTGLHKVFSCSKRGQPLVPHNMSHPTLRVDLFCFVKLVLSLQRIALTNYKPLTLIKNCWI